MSPVSESIFVLSCFVLDAEAIPGGMPNCMRYLASLLLVLPNFQVHDYLEQKYFLRSEVPVQEMMSMVFGNLYLRPHQ